MVSRPPLRKENWPAGAPCQPSRRRKPGAPRAKRAEKEAGAPIGFGPEMEEPRRIAGHRRKHSDRAGATAEKRVKLGKSRDREPEESASVVGSAVCRDGRGRAIGSRSVPSGEKGAWSGEMRTVVEEFRRSSGPGSDEEAERLVDEAVFAVRNGD